MGFFDDFNGIFADLKDLGNEIQGIKDEFISSVVDPSGELRNVINDIATDVNTKVNSIHPSNLNLKGGTPPSDITTPPVSTSIPVTDANDDTIY